MADVKSAIKRLDVLISDSEYSEIIDLSPDDAKEILELLKEYELLKDQNARLIRQKKYLTLQVTRLKEKGHWETKIIRGDKAMCCSVCGGDSGTIYDYPFCPNCGADMRKDSEQDA